MNKLLTFLVLPRDISAFEAGYLRRLNKIALAFFAAHVPLFTLLAWANDTGPTKAFAFSLLVLAGPLLAFVGLSNPRTVSVVYGVAAMAMGGLLVHFGQGPVQIEMHFYFFALLAMLAVFGNPLVIVAATVTVALHHLALWWALPRSIFNYDAPVWVVAVHAGFVVLEAVATCFIARSFFDNVIGLEKIVTARTLELDRRTADMRLVLDNVEQGFVTIDRTGKLSHERSRTLDGWLGAPAPGATIFDMLAQVDPSFARRSRLGWEDAVDGIMPLDVMLDQMPASVEVGGRRLQVRYQAIGTGDAPDSFLVVIADVSEALARELAEREQREIMLLTERLLADRPGFLDFFQEANALVASITDGSRHADLPSLKRALHTLKGNAAIYGLQGVADLCHALETHVVEEHEPPPADRLATLAERWQRLTTQVDALVGAHRSVIEVEPSRHLELEVAARHRAPALVRMVHDLKLEPTERRLAALATDARRIAERLGKENVSVVTEANGLGLDSHHWTPFWSAFIHAVRNALDHGVDSAEERAARGKPETCEIAIRSRVEGHEFVVEIQDDGRGIDWEAVRRKAAARGLPSETARDLEDALFADGVSTADHVSEISGRGVGMGALRETVTELGGRIDVLSERGHGTTLRMTFPREMMTPDFVPAVRPSYLPPSLSVPPLALVAGVRTRTAGRDARTGGE